MRTIKRWGLAGALAGTLAFGACSSTNSMLGRDQQTWTMATSDKTPAAKGKVEVGGGKGGNHEVKVEVEHLAKADDVPLSENNDGTSKLASNIVNRQLKTTAKFKYGGAAIVQSDATSGSADKSVKGQTVLIFLGGSIAQAAEK